MQCPDRSKKGTADEIDDGKIVAFSFRAIAGESITASFDREFAVEGSDKFMMKRNGSKPTNHEKAKGNVFRVSKAGEIAALKPVNTTPGYQFEPDILRGAKRAFEIETHTVSAEPAWKDGSLRLLQWMTNSLPAVMSTICRLSFRTRVFLVGDRGIADDRIYYSRTSRVRCNASLNVERAAGSRRAQNVTRPYSLALVLALRYWRTACFETRIFLS